MLPTEELYAYAEKVIKELGLNLVPRFNPTSPTPFIAFNVTGLSDEEIKQRMKDEMASHVQEAIGSDVGNFKGCVYSACITSFDMLHLSWSIDMIHGTLVGVL